MYVHNALHTTLFDHSGTNQIYKASYAELQRHWCFNYLFCLLPRNLRGSLANCREILHHDQ